MARRRTTVNHALRARSSTRACRRSKVTLSCVVRRNIVLGLAAGALGFFALLWLLSGRERGREPEGTSGGAQVASASRSPPPLDPALGSIDDAIERAADYLVRVSGADGRFEYRLFIDGRHGAKQKYNILRHAGSIYALADYRAATTQPATRARTQESMTRAVEYLRRSIRPLAAHPEMRAVWSDPKEEGGARPAAKLGGAGLALIAITSKLREDATPDVDASALLGDGGKRESEDADAGSDLLGTLQALGRFVLFMQQPSGDFHAKYEEPKGFVTDFESLYYPGEAILGLTMLYEVDRDKRWLEAGARSVAYLVESRRSAKRLPNDHWLMIAIDQLLRVYGELAAPPLTREAVLEHSVALGRTMMDEQARVLARPYDPEIDGAFASDARTTPSATRLEGLLALEHALGRDADPARAAFRADLRRTIARGVAFLRRSQVKDGLARGGIPMALKAVAEDAGDGSDDEREHDAAQEVRIDYVQHALSAMLRHRAMCAGGFRTEGDGCPAASP
jgi:hypothetical protein